MKTFLFAAALAAVVTASSAPSSEADAGIVEGRKIDEVKRRWPAWKGRVLCSQGDDFDERGVLGPTEAAKGGALLLRGSSVVSVERKGERGPSRGRPERRALKKDDSREYGADEPDARARGRGKQAVAAAKVEKSTAAGGDGGGDKANQKGGGKKDGGGGKKKKKKAGAGTKAGETGAAATATATTITSSTSPATATATSTSGKEDLLRQRLDENENLWDEEAGWDDYDAVMSIRCGNAGADSDCGGWDENGGRNIVLEVRNGAAMAAPANGKRYPTVENLFDFIRSFVDGEGPRDEMTVRYSSSRGYPEEIYVDYDEKRYGGETSVLVHKIRSRAPGSPPEPPLDKCGWEGSAGEIECPWETYCCNKECAICAPMGGVCTQQFCAFPSENGDDRKDRGVK